MQLENKSFLSPIIFIFTALKYMVMPFVKHTKRVPKEATSVAEANRSEGITNKGREIMKYRTGQGEKSFNFY